MSNLTDRVFKALGDTNRRRILEILTSTPGATVQEICSQFPTSRFAVMKHLNILETAGLIQRVRDGASKRVYLRMDQLEPVVMDWLRSLKDGR
ncbi:MAG: ArsR/SmtB family transcription factor [Spirochaetaceae bacterium]